MPAIVDLANVIINGGTYPLYFTYIEGTAGTIPVVPASDLSAAGVPANSRVYLVRSDFVLDATGTAQWKSSGGTVLSGAYPLSANTGVGEGAGGVAVTRTLVGEGLNLVTTGGGAHGTIVYALAP